MSNRLNQEKEEILQPQRITSCKSKLEKLGFEVNQLGNTELQFMFNGSLVKFWPYSGWHSGKSIKDGRGFSNLLEQLKSEADDRCPICGNEIIEYDDYIEYGNPEVDGGNDGQYYIRMCSNENCENYGGF